MNTRLRMKARAIHHATNTRIFLITVRRGWKAACLASNVKWLFRKGCIRDITSTVFIWPEEEKHEQAD